MNYTPTKWQNKVTPLNADNLNKLEQAVATMGAEIGERSGEITALESAVNEKLVAIHQTKANAIIQKASGTGIKIEGSADAILKFDEIGGVSEQVSTTGKNLYNYDNVNKSHSSSVTATINSRDNGKFNITTNGSFILCIYGQGTLTTIDSNTLEKLPKVTEGKKYTFSYESDTTATKMHYVQFYNENGESIVAKEGDIQHWIVGEGTFVTFTVPTGAYAASCNMQIHDITEKTTFNIWNIQLEEGEVATEWEPYTGGQPSPNPDHPQEIEKVVVSEIKTYGVQLLNLDNVTVGYVKTSGELGTANSNILSDYIALGEQGITIALNAVIFNIGVAYYDADKNFIETIETHSVRQLVIEAREDVNYIRVWFNIDEKDIGDRLADYEPMVNAGTAALPWEPYTESTIRLSSPIELCGIGDVQDVIDVENGVVRKRFKEVVFAGKNYSVTNMDIRGHNRFCIQNILPDKPYFANKNASFTNLLNSHFAVSGIPTGDNSLNNACAGYLPDPNLYIRADQFATVEEFKAFFAENPMTVVYELSEEITEPLPTADRIALNSLLTYDGVTYLEFDSVVEPTSKVECVLDTKAYIDKKFAELQALLS